VVFPSNAAEAGVPAFSMEEADAVFPWDSRVSTAMAGLVTARPDAINTTREAMSRPKRYRPGLREGCTASPCYKGGARRSRRRREGRALS
jgi:hypothetical protein